jgi:hypothetical protein
MVQAGSAHQNRAVLERTMKIITDGDYDALEDVLHPDFVQEMPQSGERVVGIKNFRKILENLPGGGSTLTMANDPHIAGDEEHYVMTPTFTVVKIEGAGDELTSYVKAKYPDGSDWYIVTFSSYKDGKMIKRVDFYAPFYPPPVWRARWVEKL